MRRAWFFIPFRWCSQQAKTIFPPAILTFSGIIAVHFVYFSNVIFTPVAKRSQSENVLLLLQRTELSQDTQIIFPICKITLNLNKTSTHSFLKCQRSYNRAKINQDDYIWGRKNVSRFVFPFSLLFVSRIHV